MSLYNKLINNVSNPQGFLGKIVVSLMNSGHTTVSLWGLDLLPQDKLFRSIIDIGCGGGANVKRLVELYPGSKTIGLDYSIESVNKSRKLNSSYIQDGRASIVQGNVSHLEFSDSTFDLACAFETVYFWPGPQMSFNEVYRVLKPGGIFLVVIEATGDDKSGQKWERKIKGMHAYTKLELQNILQKAGFKNIDCVEESGKTWLGIVCEK